MPKRPENAVVLDGITHEIQAADKAEILVLADLHIGDRHSDVRLIQELVNSVRDIPNRYAILAGDIMNNAIIGSKSDTYTETMAPMDQMSYAVKLLEPIKDKILAVVPGNHEDRTTRTVGFDLTLAICAQLGIAQCYRENAALLFVKFGKKERWTSPCLLFLHQPRAWRRQESGRQAEQLAGLWTDNRHRYLCSRTYTSARVLQGQFVQGIVGQMHSGVAREAVCQHGICLEVWWLRDEGRLSAAKQQLPCDYPVRERTQNECYSLRR